MLDRLKRLKHWKRLKWGLVLVLLIGGLCGCQTAHYYRQAISGELQILRQRQPIKVLLTDPALDPKLKSKFQLVLELRDFAQKDLKLPIDKHYLSYVDLHRRFAVWNVHAAPEFSLEPKKWWYPLVGRLKYRGFFSEHDARQYGAELTGDGNDVYVEGVDAYSTLGWFADPLLNTFIGLPEMDLAEVIFHELTHQRLFLGGDTDFNEAFATAVAEEGVRRWFLARKDEAGYARYLKDLERNRQFVALIMHTRTQLQELYGDSPRTRDGFRRAHRASANRSWMGPEKARIIAELRDRYAQLKRSWDGYSGYDAWFGRSLNNAQLNTISLYYDLVPGFQVLMRKSNGNLEEFYRDVEAFKHLNKDQRHQRLHQLAAEAKALG
jgi:predicted aminopeptidase